MHAALPERRALIENLPEDPIKGINAFEKLLAEQALRHLSRECWRIILSAQFLEPGGRAHRTGIRLNLLIKRQYVGLLRTYQIRGRLQPWIDVASLSELIVGITTWNFAKCVSSSSMTIPQLLAIGVTQTHLIMSGLARPVKARGRRELARIT